MPSLTFASSSLDFYQCNCLYSNITYLFYHYNILLSNGYWAGILKPIQYPLSQPPPPSPFLIDPHRTALERQFFAKFPDGLMTESEFIDVFHRVGGSDELWLSIFDQVKMEQFGPPPYPPHPPPLSSSSLSSYSLSPSLFFLSPLTRLPPLINRSDRGGGV